MPAAALSPLAFSLTTLVVPTCALVAIGLLYATTRAPGMRPNLRRKAKRSGKLSQNRTRSMASRGILVVPKEGL